MYVVVVIAALDIANIQSLHSANLELMIEAAFISILLWLIVGTFIIYYAQSQMKTWYKNEAYAHNYQELDKLAQSYDKIYKKLENVGDLQQVKLKKIRGEMEYLILRLAFINPVALPSMSESYLRKDFHFAMYLSFCLGKVLTRFFKWSLWTLVLLFLAVIVLDISFDAIENVDVRLYLNFSFLVVCFVVLVLLKSCLTSAEKKLTPSVFDDKTGKLRNPDHFNVAFNEKQGAVDPFVQYEELPRMAYLEFDNNNTDLTDVEKDQLNNDDERQALLNQSVASAKGGGGVQARQLQNQKSEEKARSIKDAFAVNNKHEALFCCGRRGANVLILTAAQLFFILTVVFLAFKLATVQAEFAAAQGDSGKVVVHGVLLAFALVLLGYLWAAVVPGLLISFAVTTNVSIVVHCFLTLFF